MKKASFLFSLFILSAAFEVPIAHADSLNYSTSEGSIRVLRDPTTFIGADLQNGLVKYSSLDKSKMWCRVRVERPRMLEGVEMAVKAISIRIFSAKSTLLKSSSSVTIMGESKDKKSPITIDCGIDSSQKDVLTSEQIQQAVGSYLSVKLDFDHSSRVCETDLSDTASLTLRSNDELPGLPELDPKRYFQNGNIGNWNLSRPYVYLDLNMGYDRNVVFTINGFETICNRYSRSVVNLTNDITTSTSAFLTTINGGPLPGFRIFISECQNDNKECSLKEFLAQLGAHFDAIVATLR